MEGWNHCITAYENGMEESLSGEIVAAFRGVMSVLFVKHCEMDGLYIKIGTPFSFFFRVLFSRLQIRTSAYILKHGSQRLAFCHAGSECCLYIFDMSRKSSAVSADDEPSPGIRFLGYKIYSYSHPDR